MRIPIVKVVPVRRSGFTAYQLEYSINGQRYREIVSHSKKEAEMIRGERQHQLNLGIHGLMPHEVKTISLKGLIDEYQHSKHNFVRESTFGRYKNYFDRFYEFLERLFPRAIHDIRLLRTMYFQECFIQLTKEPVAGRKPWHQNTVNILRDLLLEMFNNAVEAKYIEVNPVKATRQFNVPKTNTLKFYVDEQLELIRKNIEPEWLPIINFLVFTGLRKNELINLNWENVSLDESAPSITITSNEEYQTKTGKSQTIRITRSALEILKGQVGKHPKYVFPGANGHTMRKADPNEALARALKGQQFSGTIHMFRHTFAAMFLMSGAGTIYDLA
ncbi:MAG: tyrosine-type recombinase/integrase [Ignavibacteria bacterium]|nr:tyrosine-type recombinase/integrase [Ignavibacteria bacterium]